MQEREITEIKSTKRPNATQRNAAWQCEKQKSEKEGRRRQWKATQRGRKRNHRNVNRPDAMQRSAEVQEREITEIKSMKTPNATQRTQCRSVRNRNQRKKVDEEAQWNATQRGRKRNHRNKVNEET